MVSLRLLKSRAHVTSSLMAVRKTLPYILLKNLKRAGMSVCCLVQEISYYILLNIEGKKIRV